MSGSMSTFRNRRIIYSPLLRPAVKGGKKCVLLDDELKDTHPSLYKEILDFAKKNHLPVKEED
jgi:HKD family nuclease